MGTRYRVQCLRPDHRTPSLVGDYDDVEAARSDAQAIKTIRPADQVTITPGVEHKEEIAQDLTLLAPARFEPTGDSEEIG
jgi:hypothetical protein